VPKNPAVTNLILLGPMGVGKTTIGRLLAAALDRPFLDSDTEIEQATGRTSQQIAATEGVAELHRIEAGMLLDALESPAVGVIAAAASVVDDKTCLAALAAQTCVLLEAPDPVLADRTNDPGHRRPTGHEERAALSRRRADMWRELSGVVVDTSQTDPANVVAVILEGLGLR
jgi:shikimate kinase